MGNPDQEMRLKNSDKDSDKNSDLGRRGRKALEGKRNSGEVWGWAGLVPQPQGFKPGIRTGSRLEPAIDVDYDRKRGTDGLT